MAAPARPGRSRMAPPRSLRKTITEINRRRGAAPSDCRTSPAARQRLAKIGHAGEIVDRTERIDMRQHGPDPPALAAKSPKRSSGLTQITRRLDLASRSISASSLSRLSRSSPSVKRSVIAPWPSTRRDQSRLKRSSASPIRVPPDQSTAMRRAPRQRIVGIAGAHRAGHVGQAGAEQEGRDAPRFAQGMQEMQEEAGVFVHRPGDVAQRDDRRGAIDRRAELEVDHAAGLQRTAEAAARVDPSRPAAWREAPRSALVFGHRQPLDRLAGLLDLRRAHLREILRSQDLRGRHGQAGVEVDRGRRFGVVAGRLEKGVGDAAGPGLGRLRSDRRAPAGRASRSAFRGSPFASRRCGRPGRTAGCAHAS